VARACGPARRGAASKREAEGRGPGQKRRQCAVGGRRRGVEARRLKAAWAGSEPRMRKGRTWRGGENRAARPEEARAGGGG
jgi:hypothetical protein